MQGARVRRPRTTQRHSLPDKRWIRHRLSGRDAPSWVGSFRRVSAAAGTTAGSTWLRLACQAEESQRPHSPWACCRVWHASPVRPTFITFQAGRAAVIIAMADRWSHRADDAQVFEAALQHIHDPRARKARKSPVSGADSKLLTAKLGLLSADHLDGRALYIRNMC